jgi:hypothetical protein
LQQQEVFPFKGVGTITPRSIVRQQFAHDLGKNSGNQGDRRAENDDSRLPPSLRSPPSYQGRSRAHYDAEASVAASAGSARPGA